MPMPGHRLLYYITDRSAFPGDEANRRRCLLEKIAEAACAGVDYIQLREKDLTAGELESLTREAVRSTRHTSTSPETGHSQRETRLLINSRTDMALAVGAAGVHLRSDDISPSDVRSIWARGLGTPASELPASTPIVAVSCHTPKEVAQAAVNGADFAVFAPVFEKICAPGSTPAGLHALREACRAPIPVIGLGGISLENVAFCLDAGAAGIAAIRLFQENDIATTVGRLRSL